MPKGTGRVNGPFGLFNRPTSDVRSDLRSLRERCSVTAKRLQGPFTGRVPYDKLRHLYAHVMQLDVIFQPIKGWFPIRGKNGCLHRHDCGQLDHLHPTCSCRKKQVRAWAYTNNPVWGEKCAPNGAHAKAKRLCSLLNVVVSHGHYVDLTHDLMRISIMIWKMSQKDFIGLCRRIAAKIAAAVRKNSQSFRKSPEPVERFGSLTMNPANNCRVSWFPTSKRSSRKKKGSKYVPRYVPPHRR